MNKKSSPLFLALLVVLLLAVAGALIATSFPTGAFHSGTGPTLMFFDEDLSDSAFGWIIAIPVMAVVGIVVMAVLAGAALITVVALAFAAVLVVLAMLLAFTPIAVFLAIPMLAIYGLFRLFQRDQRKLAAGA